MDEDFSPYTSVDGASIFVSLGKTEERERERERGENKKGEVERVVLNIMTRSAENPLFYAFFDLLLREDIY